MNIESLTTGQGNSFPTGSLSPGVEKINKGRTEAKKDPAAAAATEGNKSNQPQPEELLQSIKALTDNGAYSVHFEMNNDTKELVINLIDQKSGETIRQIPPKEILGLHKTLNDIRGNLIQTES